MKRGAPLLLLLAAACADQDSLTESAVAPQNVVVPAAPITRLEFISVANAINAHGAIAGLSRFSTGHIHATIWRNGTRVSLGALPGQFGSEATDINDLGHAVGNSGPRAFIWYDDARALVDLGTLGGASARAWAINNRDQIVGESQLASGEWHAFLWDKGVMRDLGLLVRTTGLNKSIAYDINDHGVVVGVSTVPGPFNALDHAFRWQDGVMTDINGSTAYSHARGINNHGLIVGSMFSGGVGVPVRWSGATPLILPSLGRGGMATDINDEGVIVGESMNMVGQQHAVLWDDNGIRDLGTDAPSIYSRANAVNLRGVAVGFSGDFGAYWGTLAPPNRAPVLNVGGPYVGFEGSNTPFAISASDPDGDAVSLTVNYGDGTTGTSVSGHQYVENGTFTLTVTAADTRGASVLRTTTVDVANRAPVITMATIGETLLIAGETFSASGTFSDAGVLDTHTGFASYGDGPEEPVALASNSYRLNHVYARDGVFQFSVRIMDDDGAVGSSVPQAITVLSLDAALAHLRQLVTDAAATGQMNRGTQTRVLAFLDNTRRALERGHGNASQQMRLVVDSTTGAVQAFATRILQLL